MLIEMIELFAVPRFGAGAAFSPEERFLIEAPLARLIEKYGGLADKYSGLIDPIMLGIGAVMYGSRLSKLALDRDKPRDQDSGPGPADQPPVKPDDQPMVSVDPLIFNYLGGGFDR